MTDREARFDDRMDPARSAALLTALGRVPAPSEVAEGAPLPPFFHHIHFWDAQPPGALGRDGHPATGGLIPETGLPRRMWAGGRLEFRAPVRLGRPARKVTRVQDVARKVGRTGPLAFVTLRHEIVQGGQICVVEEQDLVYRADPAPGTAAAEPPRAPDGQVCEVLRFDSTLLFRYSALTFNGHRIHYDLDYCREVEGYPGLVVHGPLLAQLAMLRARRDLGPLARFSFRATAPLFHTEKARLYRDGTTYRVAGPDGRLCFTGEARQGPAPGA